MAFDYVPAMTPEFFCPNQIDFEQVKCLTHAMMALARVDGVHDSEMSLIREFYGSCSRDGDPELEEVAKGDFDPARAKALFGGDGEHRDIFVKSLVLLAYADGEYGEREDRVIRDLAQAVGLSDGDVDRLKGATQEYLLSSLAHIKNVEALREVQRKLQ